MSDAAIYLTVNASPSHGAMAARCLHSVRRTNGSIPIHVFSYGAPPRDVERAARATGATLVREPSQPKELGTFLKWLPLRSIAARRLLYLDADTVCMEDPMRLLDRYAERDFYARIEAGTRLKRSQLIGTFIVHPQVAWTALGHLRRALGARAMPVFNTGVMIFNGRSHRRIGARAEDMLALTEAWTSGEIPYPCSNLHIKEEIAASIALGQVPGLTVGPIRRRDSPWYIEVLAGDAPSLGTVVHVWSMYYPYFLERTVGIDARQRFEARAGGQLPPAPL